MTFYEMMKHGGTIEISGKGFCPAKFWREGKAIYCDTPTLGKRAKRDDMTAKKLNEHIRAMITEGFEVRINMNGGARI
ncbi:hypothetical protein EI53_01232 [Fusobacterium naviforme]|nr:hypothetical protein F7P78_06160 [Fusobacterium naviforme]PSL10170.1 hypothetical protein EI53_01232 [Fusobacterium naviforme]STO27580.1 Uncharacterised protein [Fusobacterium naviforme]